MSMQTIMSSVENTLKQLDFLKAIPMYEQRTKEWFDQRRNKLTSSDAATALGINPYKNATQLLLEKAGAGKTFEGNENTLHGQKYEAEAISHYEKLMDRTNHNFGMISFSDLDPIRNKYLNNRYHFLGGSPDGVSIDNEITNETILTQLEVKCPLRRKIKHGQIPDYYYPQVQLNMFIMDLTVTDFIEYVPKGVLGRDMELNIVRIFRNEEWFNINFPILEKFWNDVLYWRTQDIKTHPDYYKFFEKPEKITEIPTYLFIEDESDEGGKGGKSGKGGKRVSDVEEVCLFD